MTNPTCKGCPDRKLGCHDHCERFKAWQQMHKAELAYTYDMTHTMSCYPPYIRGQAPGAGPKALSGRKRRRRMKVLVACEESQEVCKAFRAKGHEAYSCDIQEPSGGHPEWHILGDCLKAIEGGAGRDHGRNRA